LKTLFLIRHAKSSWADPDLPDRERPLKARGRRAARKMGRRLAKYELEPDLVLSSPAVRALETARIIARRLHYPRRQIVLNPRLYAGSASELLHAVQELDERFLVVLLVGHNPEISACARSFSNQITHMSTCAVARFTFDVGAWTAVGTSAPIETEIHYPGKRGRE
jgi:phosphohistidine phosphatase